MNERARNRVTGAVILASLAVVFLPMLFDGAGFEQRTLPTMPEGTVHQAPAPVLDTDAPDWDFVGEVEVRREDPERGGVDGRGRHEPAPDTDSQTGPEAGPDGEAASPDTRLAQDGTPLAWSVQLATFATVDNAEALRARLLTDGYEAYVSVAMDGDRALHRVAVGPRLDRAAVGRLRDELAQRYELDGLVVRFLLDRQGAGR